MYKLPYFFKYQSIYKIKTFVWNATMQMKYSILSYYRYICGWKNTDAQSSWNCETSVVMLTLNEASHLC